MEAPNLNFFNAVQFLRAKTLVAYREAVAKNTPKKDLAAAMHPFVVSHQEMVKDGIREDLASVVLAIQAFRDQAHALRRSSQDLLSQAEDCMSATEEMKKAIMAKMEAEGVEILAAGAWTAVLVKDQAPDGQSRTHLVFR